MHEQVELGSQLAAARKDRQMIQQELADLVMYNKQN